MHRLYVCNHPRFPANCVRLLRPVVGYLFREEKTQCDSHLKNRGGREFESRSDPLFAVFFASTNAEERQEYAAEV